MSPSQRTDPVAEVAQEFPIVVSETGAEVEAAVRLRCKHRARSNAQLAFHAGIVVNRSIVGRRLGADENRAQQHETSILRMNDAAVQTNLPQPPSDRNRLVRNRPGSPRQVSLHGKGSHRIAGGNAMLLQPSHDAARYRIHVIVAGMKLVVGNRADGTPDRLAVEPHHKGKERLGARECGQDMVALIVKLRAAQFHQSGIICATFPRKLLEPRGVER